MSSVIALICFVLHLTLLVVLLLELWFFKSRKQEISSFCIKYSRSQTPGAITDMLMAECQREIRALKSCDLTDDQKQILLRFTPKDEFVSESTLRECVAELRMLRKSVAK